MSRKHPRKNKKKGTASQHTVKGVLDITRSGIGYVIVENIPNDILVRPADFNTALHGDTVRVKLVGGAKQSGRQQGVIVDILQRKQLEFLGKIEIGQHAAYFLPEVEKPMPDIFIPLSNL